MTDSKHERAHEHSTNGSCAVWKVAGINMVRETESKVRQKQEQDISIGKRYIRIDLRYADH